MGIFILVFHSRVCMLIFHNQGVNISYWMIFHTGRG